MSDPMTDRYGSHEPEHEDWEEYDDHGPQVLWGRVVALGAAIVLAFIAGRAMAGGGVPSEDLQRARQAVATLEAENEDLRSQIALLETDELGDIGPTEAGEGDEEGTAPAGDGKKSSGITYVVKKGDNLSTIAKKFYDDASLGRFLARANNLANPADLSVGQKLVIPDRS